MNHFEVEVLHFQGESFKARWYSLAVGLLSSGSSGLWSVANLNFGAPSRYMWSLVVVNSAASASLSI